MAQIDEMEVMATNLFHERYVMNAKKPKYNKVFNRQKLEKKVDELFERNSIDENHKNIRRIELMKRAQQAFSQ